MPRLLARIAAWLVPPPVSVTIPAMGRASQAHRLAREDLVGHEDHRLFAVDPRREVGPLAGRLDRQVRADPGDDVAEVGDPLAEVVLLDPGEAGGVPVAGPAGRPRGPSGVATRSGRGPWRASPRR